MWIEARQTKTREEGMEKAKILLGVLILTVVATHLMLDAAMVLVAEPTKWEYGVESIPDMEWGGQADELGKAGWEIITCRRAQDANDQMMYECIVKREIRP